MQIHNEDYMKIFFLLIAITITNFLYPCNWMLDMVDRKQIESHRVLLEFGDCKYCKDAEKDDLTELEAYWYTVGRTEALTEVMHELHSKTKY